MKSETKEEIDQYINYGRQPSGFLSAVISNDLADALYMADSQNAIDLREIVKYVNDKAPVGCRGSQPTIRYWVKCGGLAGITGVLK
jgi:hypothetical protein